MEVWKKVKGYENTHEASSQGRIKSIKRKVKNRFGYTTVHEKILKQSQSKNGYLLVHLCEKTFYTHKIIAETFIGDTKGLQVNHKNFDKTDNRLKNLEIVTNKENIDHAINRFKSKINKSEAREIKGLLNSMTQVDIAKKFNISQPTISAIKRGVFWKHVIY